MAHNNLACIHKGETYPSAKIVVEFDKEVDLSDHALCVWLLGSNIDPVRDCKIIHQQLIIDATAKPHLTQRPYPNVVCSSNEVIAQIDKLWNELSIGSFVPSPSIKMAQLNPNHGAKRNS
jgi:3-polyprenyl-4-hydroxybenzoate decarboxylase